MKATITLEIEVEIEVVDEAVTRCVDDVDGWRTRMFYDLDTPEKVFEHLAYNVVMNHCSLSRLDGWADLPEEAMSATVEIVGSLARVSTP